jgi:tetratricopeptide (TPR) repeat protein
MTRVALSIGLLLGTAPAAFASGGMRMPSPPPNVPRIESSADQARDAYNDGVRVVKKGDSALQDAAKATDPARRDKTSTEAHQRYGAALAKFQQAVQLNPDLAEAWNYVGYTNRKLGNYDEALSAYEKALTLKPGFPDALEYRGEAYLALNRIADAKQAYLDLFAGNRKLADKLLSAMKDWVATRRAPGGGSTGEAGTATAGDADTAHLDELDKWIQERAQIAGQTAALTRAGAAASWR